MRMRSLVFALLVGFALTIMEGCTQSGASLPMPASQAARFVGAAKHDSWSLKKALPHAVLGPASGAIGTKIYVAGGIDNTLTPTGDNQIYDTTTNKWSKGAPMPTPRWDLGSTVVNGILYTIGGYTSLSTVSNVVEAYDPAHDTWSEEATLPIANGPVAAGRRRLDLRNRRVQRHFGGTAGKRLRVQSENECVDESSIDEGRAFESGRRHDWEVDPRRRWRRCVRLHDRQRNLCRKKEPLEIQNTGSHADGGALFGCGGWGALRRRRRRPERPSQRSRRLHIKGE